MLIFLGWTSLAEGSLHRFPPAGVADVRVSLRLYQSVCIPSHRLTNHGYVWKCLRCNEDHLNSQQISHPCRVCTGGEEGTPVLLCGSGCSNNLVPWAKFEKFRSFFKGHSLYSTDVLQPWPSTVVITWLSRAHFERSRGHTFKCHLSKKTHYQFWVEYEHSHAP